MNDDAALLRRYVEEHSETAFTKLVRRQLNLVYSAALRRCRGDAHRAAEVAQQVFTALARQAPSLQRHTVLTAWLYATTRNIAVDLLRREQRRQIREQEAHLMHELFANSAPGADWECLRPVLDETMDELSTTDRTAVLLRVFDRPFAEIGAALNVTEDAARMRVDRALDKLRVLLAKRGITSTTAALAATLTQQAVASAPAGMAANIAVGALGGAAATGAGTLATALYFMSASKIILSLAAAGALAIGAAVYQSRQAQTAAAKVADASSDHAALTARLAELEGRVNTAETALAQQRATNPTASASSELSPAALAVLAQNARFQEALTNLRQKDPVFRKARETQNRATRMAEYRPLFQSLGFTSAQIEQACDYMAERARMRTQQPASGAARDTTNEDSPANFWAQFGPDVAERVAQFEKTAGARNFVDDLSARTYFLDEPFTAQQSEQLVQIIDSARPPGTPQRSSSLELGATMFRRTLNWDKILAQAGTLLSPNQLQGLRAMAAQARVDTQLAAAANESAAPPK